MPAVGDASQQLSKQHTHSWAATLGFGSPLGGPAMCCTVRDRHLEGGPGYSRFVRFIGIGVCNCAAPNDTPKRLHHRITLRNPAVSASSGIA
jgi:hypothetical protein